MPQSGRCRNSIKVLSSEVEKKLRQEIEASGKMAAGDFSWRKKQVFRFSKGADGSIEIIGGKSNHLGGVFGTENVYMTRPHIDHSRTLFAREFCFA